MPIDKSENDKSNNSKKWNNIMNGCFIPFLSVYLFYSFTIRDVL